MEDIQVTYLRDVVPTYQADLISLNPLVFRLTGGGYTGASTVLYGGEPITEGLTVYSDRVMDVVIPDHLVDRVQGTVAVLSEVFISSPRSHIRFDLSNPGRRTSGVHRMSQQFVLTLLATPGSSVFNNLGGGLLQILRGVSEDMDDLKPLAVDISTAVRRTVLQMQDSYVGYSVPIDEQILSADVIRIYRDEETSELRVVLGLYSAAGQSAAANLAL